MLAPTFSVTNPQATPGTPGKTPRSWTKRQNKFNEVLGWTPAGKVRGKYWVEVINEGRNFRATGISDVDGDGVFATYVATKSINPNSPITGQKVY